METSTMNQSHKYFKTVTLPGITDNYKTNGKSYIISELQLYAPTMRIIAHDPPLYKKCVWLIKSQLKVSSNMSKLHK
jgi:hypothetical protein